ncbi:MAG: tetratricopeptide repeat protein [Magnetococcales bacterium]|nr:tetratricopeptide repeat protein [Magnetococcales bacterium]
MIMDYSFNTFRNFAVCSLFLLLPSCVSDREKESVLAGTEVDAFLADKPAQLRDHLIVYKAQGRRNQVLNADRIGLASMELKDLKLARLMFDAAVNGIESIYANTPEAQLARSNFFKEAVKDFKGDPYERSMTFYYSGLLYLMNGDHENAGAHFLGGFIQDSMSMDDQFNADFSSLVFLQGWAAHCGGKKEAAQEHFQKAKLLNPKLPIPKETDNLLVVAETGLAPIKYSSGVDDVPNVRVIKLRKGGGNYTPHVQLPPLQGNDAQMEEAEDLYFQASTRGGRAFDALLAGKATVKSALETVSTAAGVGAAAGGVVAATALTTGHKDNANAAGIFALGALAVSLSSRLAANNVEVDADARYWDNLPQKLFIKTITDKNSKVVNVNFYDEKNFLKESKSTNIYWAGTCGIAWLRSQSAFPTSPRAPYSISGDTTTKPLLTKGNTDTQ